MSLLRSCAPVVHGCVVAIQTSCRQTMWRNYMIKHRGVSTTSQTSDNNLMVASLLQTSAAIRQKFSQQDESQWKKNAKVTLIERLIHVRRISKATGGGKKRSVHALVVVGDANGSAGYGEGRALDATNAVQKALKNARKNMTFIERFQNRTVFSDMKHVYQSVHLDIKIERPGYGIVANNHIHQVCRCAGIHDIAVKIRGSTNPLNVVKAMFDALKSQRSPLDIAKGRGRKAEDVYSTYYGFR